MAKEVREQISPLPEKAWPKAEATCMKCRKTVNPINVTVIKKGNRVRIAGQCPKCGSNVTRFSSMDKVKEMVA